MLHSRTAYLNHLVILKIVNCDRAHRHQIGWTKREEVSCCKKALHLYNL